MLIKNYLYNLIYQILNILIPIITVPYISRVLGAEGMGAYALSASYAQYFVLFGMIGLSIYSSREVAYFKDDNEKLNKVFWELNFLRFITMGICIFIYLLLFGIYFEQNRFLNIIQITILLSAFFDISWLFIGLEDFKKVSIRNSIVKIIGIVLIFLFVKNSHQVWLYALILGFTQLIGQISMWFEIPKDLKFSIPKKYNLLKHINASLKLFIPQIAINIYTMLDKVMLGVFTDDIQVGLYDNSQRIIKILITIVTTLSTVISPQMCSLYKSGDIVNFKNKVYKAFSFVSFLAFPMTLGLISVCKTFVPWFFGDGFGGIIPMFYCGAWMMISLAWSSILGNQILISIRRDKSFTIAVSVGAIINIILNFIFIKTLKGVGTTISSVLAEFTGMFLMLYFVRDIIELKILFKGIYKYIFSSIIMASLIYFIGNYFDKNTMFVTVLQVFCGITIYLIIMLITKDNNLNFIINFLRKKVNTKD
ncbi:oligosaccharide flippase family protein [Clostridium perfringens]|uniref:oligosaccharide flippase family protein n=1 Tax=Clostridium perfringens TaxID=1502 RepID=UPI002246800E|nr:oligosaccharide flippase family protein [Clostridium perfringens]MCX0389401.1 oligosaccharide flippase family protein [Clostridium perfringens]MDZ5015621.1 oligosaccharide flippase family protein [Clostridium perfringens]